MGRIHSCPWPGYAPGYLTEVRATDLRFTHAEAAGFLNQVMGINLRSSPINIRRGEGGREWKGGPLGSPAGWGGGRVSPRYQPEEQDAGDHKGPPNPTSSSLAPTDRPALGLASRLRVMRIGRPRGSPLQYKRIEQCRQICIVMCMRISPSFSNRLLMILCYPDQWEAVALDHLRTK